MVTWKRIKLQFSLRLSSLEERLQSLALMEASALARLEPMDAQRMVQSVTQTWSAMRLKSAALMEARSIAMLEPDTAATTTQSYVVPLMSTEFMADSCGELRQFENKA